MTIRVILSGNAHEHTEERCPRPLEQYRTYEAPVAAKEEDHPVATLADVPRFPRHSRAQLVTRSEAVRSEAAENAKTVVEQFSPFMMNLILIEMKLAECRCQPFLPVPIDAVL